MPNCSEKTGEAMIAKTLPCSPGADERKATLPISLNNDGNQSAEDIQRKKRREIFGGCALIEIIHLHDCLRGALSSLEFDVVSLERQIKNELSTERAATSPSGPLSAQFSAASLERRIAGRFKVIWSVFRSHSQAEDEYIWPALKKKTQNYQESDPHPEAAVMPTPCDPVEALNDDKTAHAAQIEQAEYEEDHADEEKMFREMNTLLTELRQMLRDNANHVKITDFIGLLSTKTHSLSQHLLKHLEKEETQCLPLVVKHLTNEEIHNLVGDIMGKRSADLIVQIMTMAIQNLDIDEREEMVKYMKESMAGTFFDRWLSMTWPNIAPLSTGNTKMETTSENLVPQTLVRSVSASEDRKRPAEATSHVKDTKRGRSEGTLTFAKNISITSQAELEKLIRAIATNSSLTPEQRNTTIQGLRDSVWRSNQQQRRLSEEVLNSESMRENQSIDDLSQKETMVTQSIRRPDPRRVTPPSKYFRKNEEGVIECINFAVASPDQGQMPLFTPSELAPTFHDGAAGAVLGCPHYPCACKLRHPVSGKLYTCRLCCEQHRELLIRELEEPLDRYSVSEVFCMICNALQPASKGCINSDCESYGRPFAKYFCEICNLYDDSSRPAFHCPYCNACRRGHGLGIDYRHCMRCNACVSLSEKEHQCIPQKLQGNCPICSESLFESTVQLRGLKCGHVMHLSCFADYRRNQYTCPLCKKSMEDMSDYFSLLDAAVWMQPMPIYHSNTMSSIYCQDCEQHSQTKYHLVGLKCTNCNSYNTRELNRVELDVSQPQT